MENASPPNGSVVARLYAAWIFMRNELEPLIKCVADIDESIVDPKLEAIWAVEHAISAIKPTNMDDVRLKSIVLKKWMEDAATENILDDFLDSLVEIAPASGEVVPNWPPSPSAGVSIAATEG